MSSKQTSFSNKMRNPRTRIYLPELFEEAITKKNVGEIIDLIKDYNSKNDESAKRLRDFLQCVYHPAVVLDLPDSIPPYDNTQYIDYDMAPLTLEKALSRCKYFVKGQSSYIQEKIKREHTFIQTLESLHKKDSALLESVLLKKFPVRKYPGLGIEVFFDAVPEYLDGIDIEDVFEDEKQYRKVTNQNLTTEQK